MTKAPQSARDAAADLGLGEPHGLPVDERVARLMRLGFYDHTPRVQAFVAYGKAVLLEAAVAQEPVSSDTVRERAREIWARAIEETGHSEWAQHARDGSRRVSTPTDPIALRAIEAALTSTDARNGEREARENNDVAIGEFIARWEDAADGVCMDCDDAQMLARELKRLRDLIHVPGVWRCAKCSFTLVQSNLNAGDGTVTPRDEPGDKCPNDGSPLWRVSYRDWALENEKGWEELLARKDAELAALNTPAQEPDKLNTSAERVNETAEALHVAQEPQPIAHVEAVGEADNGAEIIAVTLEAEAARMNLRSSVCKPLMIEAARQLRLCTPTPPKAGADVAAVGREERIEAVARAICLSKGLSPDTLYQHNFEDEYPEDARREYRDPFTHKLRVQLFHKSWRHLAKAAEAAIDALALLTTQPSAGE